jgi:hypothetical protein
MGEYECLFFSDVTLGTKVAACGPVNAQPLLHVESLLLKALLLLGVGGSVVVNALCYKPEGRGFDAQMR